jgi:hypothetical protein
VRAGAARCHRAALSAVLGYHISAHGGLVRARRSQPNAGAKPPFGTNRGRTRAGAEIGDPGDSRPPELLAEVEVERWDAALLELPTRAAVRDYLIGKGRRTTVTESEAQTVAAPCRSRRGALSRSRARPDRRAGRGQPRPSVRPLQSRTVA